MGSIDKALPHAGFYPDSQNIRLTLQRYELFLCLPNNSRFILSFFSKSSLVSKILTIFALNKTKNLRKNNISKQEFAKMLDVTPAQVTKLLSGKENLGLKTISKIESVFQID